MKIRLERCSSQDRSLKTKEVSEAFGDFMIQLHFQVRKYVCRHKSGMKGTSRRVTGSSCRGLFPVALAMPACIQS